MNIFKKHTISLIIITVATTVAMPAFAGWKRVGGYGGSDIYPSLTGCTTGGWTCTEVARVKKTSNSVNETKTNSVERKVASNDVGTDKIFCTDGKGNYKGAGNGCGGIWKAVEMGTK
jgi:hypothetical protein